MRLYDGGRAPNPRRVRVFLAEKGIEVPLVPVDMGALGHRSAEIAAFNPLQRLPVLVLDDGTVLTESIAICRYFEALHPEPALFGATAVLSWFWPAMHLLFAWAGLTLMAVNAFAAIWVLGVRTSMEPIRLIFMSMSARLLILAAIMLLVIRGVGHGPALYSFVFTAMAAYLVFQVVEIRHILRNPGLMKK
jgi:hypothetical protein